MEQVSKFETTKGIDHQNFGLSKADFDQMLEQLKAGDQGLFQTIFLNHFEDCLHYLKSTWKLSHTEAYDVSMDTLLLFRRKLLEGKIRHGNMRFLFTRMAYQLHLKARKKEAQIREVPPEEWWPDEEEPFDEEVLSALGKAWEKLCQDCSALLKRFYFEQFSLQELSQQMEVTAPGLRKRKQRCVEKLRGYFAQYYQH